MLQSFIDQDYDGGYEIIVVDGGPTDETIKVVKRFQKQLPNLAGYSCERGISGQRNSWPAWQASSPILSPP